MTVVPFTGTRVDDRSIFTCANCGHTAFKIVREGVPKTPFVECANCENFIEELSVSDERDSE